MRELAAFFSCSLQARIYYALSPSLFFSCLVRFDVVFFQCGAMSKNHSFDIPLFVLLMKSFILFLGFRISHSYYK